MKKKQRTQNTIQSLPAREAILVINPRRVRRENYFFGQDIFRILAKCCTPASGFFRLKTRPQTFFGFVFMFFFQEIFQISGKMA